MLQVGSSYSKIFVASEKIIEDIAKVSGDTNPIHLSEEYAQDSIFGRRIAHALFCHNIISMIIGNYLPGNGTILISQTFQYRYPVYIGDEIEAKVVVRNVLPNGKYVLHAICKNHEGKIVVEGESVVRWGTKKE